MAIRFRYAFSCNVFGDRIRLHRNERIARKKLLVGSYCELVLAGPQARDFASALCWAGKLKNITELFGMEVAFLWRNERDHIDIHE